MSLRDVERPFVLLEDRLDPSKPALLFHTPIEIVSSSDSAEIDVAFSRIERALADGLFAAGFLSYELGYVLEPKLMPRMPQERATPLLWFGLFAPPCLVDEAALDSFFGGLGAPPPIAEFVLGHDQARHGEKVLRILDLIEAGDIYQANLTFPMRFRYKGDPLALYGAMRAHQPVAEGGIIALDDVTILSVSPELFVDVTNSVATTRPMKGTAARGKDLPADVLARARLAADQKQRAENLMIVDLLRNDLSRIGAVGSVQTLALFAVETYPDFHAMTSTVTAKLRSDLCLREKIAAIFPCASVIGAPKIRAAEVICDLEEEPRGVYTGAIGMFAPGGRMHFNVAIRTAVIRADGQGTFGVGGGVVADSDPTAEYDEALLKGRVLSDLKDDFGLIETFRWAHASGFVRLERHLERLAQSAAALGFAFDASGVRTALACHHNEWLSENIDRRVRVLLSRSGEVTISSEAVGVQPALLRVCIVSLCLDGADPFLRHKTSRRTAYDRAFAEATDQGCDEAILLNRAGQIADASRNSVFIERDGRLVTPPVSAGALPGVLRAELLDNRRAIEGDVSLLMLKASARLFLGNSLHGLRPARLV